ncbi:MAG TPA: hypothetical protein VEX13_16855 [Chloroflexia bacterium]|nr:hypothetical protein [Chloroflexia bacterium]
MVKLLVHGIGVGLGGMGVLVGTMVGVVGVRVDVGLGPIYASSSITASA